MLPPTPCKTRNAISQDKEGARLHSHDPSVNRLSPTWKIVRRPIHAGVQRLADLGEPDVHDRVVEADHEQGRTADREDDGAAAGADGYSQ